MSARQVASQMAKRLPLLLVLVVLTGGTCSDPWPSAPTPARIAYLTSVPHELAVYVADPSRTDRANLVAFVQDEYGRNIDDHTTKFTISAGGAGFGLSPLGSHPDSVTLTIAPACSLSNPGCAPANRDGEVTATHGGSGLTVKIPIHVRYEKTGDFGVAATPSGETWPMYALATASVSGTWMRHAMHPFVRRVGFGKMDATDVTPPNGDEASGTVASAAYGLWRKAGPWGVAAGDMQVPAATSLASVHVRAYYAGDPSAFLVNKDAFLLALQAGADVVSHTPVGATVTIDGDVTQLSPVHWTGDCLALGTALTSALGANSPNLPSKTALAIYMLAYPAAAEDTERALQCGVNTLAASGPLWYAQAIVLPQGSALASSVAHEIGHALALDHVSYGAGFFDDNLMVLTDDISAPMRHRLTIGQAFRAGFDPKSFIVTSGQSRSAAIDCMATPLWCPGLGLDALRRTP
jgi:hypothetical protein